MQVQGQEQEEQQMQVQGEEQEELQVELTEEEMIGIQISLRMNVLWLRLKNVQATNNMISIKAKTQHQIQISNNNNTIMD